MDESDSFEEKSEFDWGNGQEIAVLKTLIAFANTRGGKIFLNAVQCDVRLLDSARIDDFVNSYVAPRINGITSEKVGVPDWHISVPASANPPHVIKKDVNALVNGKQKMLARTGDIYVRHSSKTEIATHDDIHRMFQITLSFWLSKIGQAVQTLSLDVQEGQLALPVQLSEDTTALKIGVADPNKDFPYNATLIGRKLGKSAAWVAEAIKKLEIRKIHFWLLA